MSKTKIEWTDFSWNPIRARQISTGKVGHHCTMIATGCKFCYSHAMQSRFGDNFGIELPYKKESLNDIEFFIDEDTLKQPLGWREPKKVFVCSMMDLFHPSIPLELIDQVFAVMAIASKHTFIVLTKRPPQMLEYLNGFANGDDPTIERVLRLKNYQKFHKHFSDYRMGGALPNVWLMVSGSNQDDIDRNVPILLECPAVVRGVSLEPMTGPVDLAAWLPRSNPEYEEQGTSCWNCGGDGGFHDCGECACVCLDKEEIHRPCEICDGEGEYMLPEYLDGLDWVITGGETGEGARPAHPDWFRSIRDQCEKYKTKYFHKQNGVFKQIGYDDWQKGGGIVLSEDGHVLMNRQKGLNAPALFPICDSDVLLRKTNKQTAGRLIDGIEHSEFPATNKSEVKG